ncbi:MAG: glycosyltransferase family 4 protein [Sedimentisphaerales bacterium]|nr:glycosyltransferase family 4 protein [Sedimentisphaerales bacterium]HNY80355.1 glycosyltransferase family 4 protein [Sedimentisphaerales bacterium]HOC65652.1 glycosyltransferase family 4 protein [Sedimentisphaerales bacterium]HOH66155.1 glycosyltransferase family 4 protein [Sedimentisphaerales bacterium]HQA90840.1 glycosyltransferase family 4 protein [Sedimentisphaerales bacterium]
MPAPVDVFTYPALNLPFMERVGLESLALQLERFKPTVLHGLCESRAALARRLARRLSLPYVLGVNSLTGKSHRLSISPTRCARIIVPTETVGSSVLRSHGRFADRVRQIQPGTFAGTDPVCFADPSRLSTIVVAHRLDRVSDFAVLLKAAKVLLAEGHEFMIAIMGAGRAERRLRTKLAEYGLTRVVTIVPVLDPWRSVLAAGDIFVHLQPMPTFSGFLLEAMGLGVAVVACKGGVDDLIVHEDTALLYERNSEASLRQALVRLLEDHDGARRLAASAQGYVRQRYSVGAMVSAMLDTYIEALRFSGS